MCDSKPDMPSPQNREEALFQAAVQLTGAERAPFLSGACLGDNALRKRLEALLAAHDQPDNLVPIQAESARPTIKLDLATTDVGRPFFVMELVRGIKITDYCDQANLSTKERLDLFIKVCQAIQHAHQKGIIHRDIKPSNILVTLHDGVPVPKVIDFGIAKATTDQRLTDKTLFTALEQ